MSTEIALQRPSALAAVDEYAFLDDAETRESTQLAASVQGGIFYDLSFEEYCAIPALNGSRILAMRRSPMHYHYNLTHPREATPALMFGILLHRAVLEPHLLDDFQVWGLEEWMKVRNGKKWNVWAAEATAAGKTIIAASDYDKLLTATASVLNNEPIRKYAHAPGRTEVTLVWQHHTGVWLKARLDKIIEGKHTIFDLKSTRDCRSYQFGSQAYDLGYHTKMAMYANGYEILTGHKPKVVLGAIEKEGACESAVYRLTPDVLLRGLEEAWGLLDRIAECEKANAWPGEYEEETDLILPSWTQYQELDQYADSI